MVPLAIKATSHALWKLFRINHLLEHVHIIIQEYTLLPYDIQAKGEQASEGKNPKQPSASDPLPKHLVPQKVDQHCTQQHTSPSVAPSLDSACTINALELCFQPMDGSLIQLLFLRSCFNCPKAALVRKSLLDSLTLTPPAASQKEALSFSTDLLLASLLLEKKLGSPRAKRLLPCYTKKCRSQANATHQPAHNSTAILALHTYVVSRKDPSLHLSRAFLAAGFPENSTMPFPEDRPLSSTITTALSTWPNTEKASSRSSLDTN